MSADVYRSNFSDKDILVRVERKLDHIIEILEDKTISIEEEKLIWKTDNLMKEKKLDEFVPL
ncbi:hypothetical protein [Methanospirillum hungatei]|uniref:hypothetical protein n=1 Tax=Methanospirillum hungatei TaxID=2203 RepID=UPI0026F1C0EA|nr:hypothetical protein [Methanospirillum hungatei]MCA1916684.1 hypothetical protein [Methanospirillum hungatei]